MCIWCEDSKDEIYDLVGDEINCGALGTFEVALYMSVYKENKSKHICLEVIHSERGTTVYKKLPINYCPNCGRKLSK